MRTAIQEAKLTVEIQNMHGAESHALKVIKTQEFVADEIHDELKANIEQGGKKLIPNLTAG